MRSNVSVRALTVLAVVFAAIYAWAVYHVIHRNSLLHTPGIVAVHSQSAFLDTYFPGLSSILGAIQISEIDVPDSLPDSIFDDFVREFPEADVCLVGRVPAIRTCFYVCRVPRRPEDVDGASDDSSGDR